MHTVTLAAMTNLLVSATVDTERSVVVTWATYTPSHRREKISTSPNMEEARMDVRAWLDAQGLDHIELDE
jgi:hypothetical protein